MAGRHFEHLDDEGKALHDSWDDITRIAVIVALLSIVIWAVCTGLRKAVHFTSEYVLDFAERPELAGVAVLMGALLAGGIARTLLFRRRGWGEAAGDGIDTALANYHVTYLHDGDDPQPRYQRPAFALAARKIVATFLTLGSGASGGLEAPVVMIAESISAGCARLLSIRSEYELRTYQLAGISAAVSTLLGAPFTAALFATEIAYGDRIIYRKLAYALWAGIIAHWFNTWLKGSYEPLFVGPTHTPEYSVAEITASAVVAITVSVPIALGFGKAMLYLESLIRKVGSTWHGIVTSLGVGLVALALYYGAGIRPSHVLGMGEHTIGDILAGRSDLTVWWMLGLAIVGKTITTGLTLGGGGSAGLLIPSMYLGGVAGALVAHLLNLVGFTHLDPALFAVVGVGSSLVAVVGVPLAAIALVFEVFGRAFGPPAILACGVTYLITLRFKIYKNQHTSPSPAQDEIG